MEMEKPISSILPVKSFNDKATGSYLSGKAYNVNKITAFIPIMAIYKKVAHDVAIIRNTIFINGEEFLIENSDQNIILKHPQWSLIGEGRTYQEAENNLRDECKEVYEVYSTIPPANLSQESLNMLNFLIGII